MGSVRGIPAIWGPLLRARARNPLPTGSILGIPLIAPPSPPAAPALRAAASALSRRKTESSGRSPLRRCPGSAAESEKETAAAEGPAPGPPPRSRA